MTRSPFSYSSSVLTQQQTNPVDKAFRINVYAAACH